MRFFFEFVSCCGSPTTLRPSEPTPRAEEARSLVPPVDSRPLRRRRRGRMGRCQTAPDWRPSLGSISEDGAVPQTEQRGDRRDAAVGSRRDVKRRSAGGAADAAKVRQRSYSYDYGPTAMPTIMPTFSPTPFMF